jgi:hypothetical protein
MSFFGISNDNLYDFIEETETNSEPLQDINETTLNIKSNFETYLAKDSNDISDEIIENSNKFKDAQVHEGIKFNPLAILKRKILKKFQMRILEILRSGKMHRVIKI